MLHNRQSIHENILRVTIHLYCCIIIGMAANVKTTAIEYVPFDVNQFTDSRKDTTNKRTVNVGPFFPYVWHRCNVRSPSIYLTLSLSLSHVDIRMDMNCSCAIGETDYLQLNSSHSGAVTILELKRTSQKKKRIPFWGICAGCCQYRRRPYHICWMQQT